MAVLWADGLGWPPAQRVVMYASQEKTIPAECQAQTTPHPEGDCKMP